MSGSGSSATAGVGAGIAFTPIRKGLAERGRPAGAGHHAASRWGTSADVGRSPVQPRLLAGLGITVAGGAFLVSTAPIPALLLFVVAGVVAAIVIRPAFATYLLITVTPLVVGIDRGSALPIVRPNEALSLLVGAALFGRAVWRLRTGNRRRLRLNQLEKSILIFTVAASVLPLMIMLARHRPVSGDDLIYALVLWKYVGAYVIVSASIKTAAEVRRCLFLSLGAAAVVAVVAILQVGGVGPVRSLLAAYYAPLGYVGALADARGSSTLALPAATGDLLIYNLGIAAALLSTRIGSRRLLLGAAVLFGVGVLATAEFSCALGLIIAVVIICVVNRSARFAYMAGAVAVLGGLGLQSVIAKRLSGFHSAQGLPTSWTGRLHNLQSYFWPELFHGWNSVLGVRLSARVPVASQARGYVWIESGYTWLLWGGGLPLFIAFFFLLYAGLRRGTRLAAGPPDVMGVVGRGLVVALGVMAVLMFFDPHLTYRGSADSLFVLMALSAVPGRASPTGSAVGGAELRSQSRGRT
ncbi:MAG: hypothetical protein QOC80_2562 [Frankiaceae bacterium]|nr:hypothetical protein [Frankiaceae bacterium]